MDDAEQPAPSATASGVPPDVGYPFHRWRNSGGVFSIVDLQTAQDRVDGALRIERAPTSTPDMRVWAVKGTTLVSARSRSGSGRPNSPLASATIERPSGVSSARLEARAAAARSSGSDAADRQELGGHAVAVGDGAGLVEQEGVDVAGRLDGPAGGGHAR